jgi:hypothetical protein
MAQFLTSGDDATSGGPLSTTGGVVTVPTPGSGATVQGAAITNRFLDVHWSFTEPEPVGAIQGFELAIHIGTDPTNLDSWLQPSITVGPTERRFVGMVSGRVGRTVYASTRAVYNSGYTSPWDTAVIPSPFVPDTVTFGDSGYTVQPDGTIMLWVRGASQNADGNQTITFPAVTVRGVTYTGFPNGCYCVQVVTLNEDASNLNDRFFQLINYAKDHCTVFGQGTATTADGHPVRPLVQAWGF